MGKHILFGWMAYGYEQFLDLRQSNFAAPRYIWTGPHLDVVQLQELGLRLFATRTEVEVGCLAADLAVLELGEDGASLDAAADLDIDVLLVLDERALLPRTHAAATVAGTEHIAVLVHNGTRIEAAGRAVGELLVLGQCEVVSLAYRLRFLWRRWHSHLLLFAGLDLIGILRLGGAILGLWFRGIDPQVFRRRLRHLRLLLGLLNR